MDPQLLSGSAPGASAAGKALGCRPLPRATACLQSHGLAASAPGCPPAPRERNVRSWSYTRDLPAAHSMLYNVQGSRWCGAVERQHRSNGVYYVADLKTGTWQQRCYDPLCRDYRSAAMPLPPPLWHHLLAHTNATDTNMADGGGIQEAPDEALTQRTRTRRTRRRVSLHCSSWRTKAGGRRRVQAAPAAHAPVLPEQLVQ
ncbi:hypothetical protein V8C86DRAFT_2798799 [Haematococcus lacustris]